MEWKTFDFKSQKPGRVGDVLNKYIYKCAFCNGKRFMPSMKSTKCSVCLGDGTVRIHPPAVICAYCKGTGKSHLNPNLTCSVCHGNGVVSVSTKEIEICPICKGRGREKGGSFPCLTCRGKGVIVKTGK